MDTLQNLEPQPAISAPSDLARDGLARFAAGVKAEQKRLSEQGVAWAIMDDDERMVWVHPDGTRRNGPEATADILG